MTLKDIAKEAGVSTVTISNVINGNHDKVSKETIKRVEKIIEKYNYRPNATARSLAMKESKIIGVVIPNIGEDENFLQSPYNAEVLGVLERFVRKKGYYLMIRCVKSCKEVIPLFATWNVDGLIFIGAYAEEAEEIQKRMKLPMVFMDTYANSGTIANVGADDFKGGYLSTKYMISRGHKNIAFAGPDINSPGVIRERFIGFEKAMQERDLQVKQSCIFCADTRYELGVEVGKQIAFSEEKITAVVSMSDVLALGIMEGLRLSGKIVPDDVSVIGFDNLPECRFSSPQLTTIAQNIEKKAEKAAEYLFSMIQTKESIYVDEKIDVEVVERQTVKML